ncbi:hypothetical protein Q3G72_032695 [Acer saccharum]|nr:hypothetical protein Q3G72_032695 [Acer saccharum]
METGEMKENQEAEQNGEENNKDDQNQKVSFYKLFTFADRLDVVMMIVGTLSAIMGGLAQPLMSVIFGEIVDSFGTATADNVVSVVSKASLKFVYLAIAAGIASFLRNHEELIKDPEGAYSQLVRLQDGAKNARVKNADKSEVNSYSMAKSRSQGLSMRSGSKGSSTSSRQSFGLVSISVPGTINFFETEAGADDQEKTTSEGTTEIDIEKRNQVSMRRLAYLNKPELPILLIGSIAAIIHGPIANVDSAVSWEIEMIDAIREENMASGSRSNNNQEINNLKLMDSFSSAAADDDNKELEEHS